MNWGTVCKSKESGGLGVRRLENLNKSLLGKWNWRLATEDNPSWKKLIKLKYGLEVFFFLSLKKQLYKQTKTGKKHKNPGIHRTCTKGHLSTKQQQNLKPTQKLPTPQPCKKIYYRVCVISTMQISPRPQVGSRS